MATGRIGTNTVLTTRWSKAPAGGTTSLSGLDDNSVSLVYSVGYEQVYRNGVLLSRGNDYTATNGTTITLIDATITGDIIEVFANATIPLTDTYSQTVANGKFINNTLTTTTGDIIYASAANTPARLGIGSTDQVLTVSSGVPAWVAPNGYTLLGTATPSGGEIKFTSISASYQQLVLIVEDWYTSGGAEATVRLNNDTTTANYTTVGMYGNTAAVTTYYKTGYSFIWVTGATGGTVDADNVCVVTFPNYADTNSHKVIYSYTKHLGASNGLHITQASGAYASTSAISTISFYPAGGNMNGTAYLYGVK